MIVETFIGLAGWKLIKKTFDIKDRFSPFEATARMLSNLWSGSPEDIDDKDIAEISSFLKKKSLPVNNEIQTAVLKCFYKAALEATDDCLYQKLYEQNTDSDKLKLIRKNLKNELQVLSAGPQGEDLSVKPEFLDLVKITDSDGMAEVEKLQADLNDQCLYKCKSYIYQLYDDARLPAYFVQHIQTGWQLNETRFNFFELICSFFHEELKTNERLSEILEKKWLGQMYHDAGLTKEKLNTLTINFESLGKNLGAQIQVIDNKLDQILDKHDSISVQLSRLYAKIDESTSSFIHNSKDAMRLSEQIEINRAAVSVAVSKLNKRRAQLETDPYNEDFIELHQKSEEDWQACMQKVKHTEDEFTQLVENAKDIARFIADTEKTKMSNQVKIAITALNNGAFTEAIYMLDSAESVKERERKIEEMKNISLYLKECALGLVIEAKAYLFSLPGEEGKRKARECYQKSVDTYPYYLNYFEFAGFLARHQESENAISLYNYCLSFLSENMYIQRIGVLESLGTIFERMNDPKKAIYYYENCVKLYKIVAEEDRKHYQLEIISMLNATAKLHIRLEDKPAATDLLGEAMAILERCPDKNNVEYKAELAKTIGHLGTPLLFSKENEGGKLLRQSLEIYKDLAIINPDYYRAREAEAYVKLGNYLMIQKNFDAEETKFYLSTGLAICQELATSDPENDFYLAYAYTYYGTFCLTRQQLEEGYQAYLKALEIYRYRAKLEPAVYLPAEAEMLVKLGHLYYLGKELSDERINSAISIYESLAVKYPELYLPFIFDLQLELIELDRTTYDEEVIDKYQQLMDYFLVFARQNIDLALKYVALLYGKKAMVYSSLDKFDEEFDSTKELLNFFHVLSIKNPDVYRANEARYIKYYISTFIKKGDNHETLAMMKRSIHLYTLLAQQNPADHLYNLIQSRMILGNFYKKINEFNESLVSYDLSMEDCRKHLAIETRSKIAHLYISLIGKIKYEKAGSLLLLNRNEESVGLLLEALEICNQPDARYGTLYLPTYADILVQLGDINLAEKAIAAAQENYTKAMETFTVMETRKPGSASHEIQKMKDKLQQLAVL